MKDKIIYEILIFLELQKTNDKEVIIQQRASILNLLKQFAKKYHVDLKQQRKSNKNIYEKLKIFIKNDEGIINTLNPLYNSIIK